MERCEFCERDPNDVDPQLRPRCPNCLKESPKHELCCCNGNFNARFIEFLSCPFEFNDHVPVHVGSGGMNARARLMPSMKKALEMIIPLPIVHRPHETWILVAKHREFLLIQRVQCAAEKGEFYQTDETHNSVLCTGFNSHPFDCRQWLVANHEFRPLRYRRGRMPGTIVTGSSFKQQRSCYTCKLKPASLLTLCFEAINKHRVDYKRFHIPEADMLPFLWKSCDPAAYP